MIKIIQKVFLFLFKKKIITSLKQNGFVSVDRMTVNQLHRFFFKVYEDGSVSFI